MQMTVCQLDCEGDFEAQWAALCAHSAASRADVVLLPEMPFTPWLAATRDVDPAAWDAAVTAHDAWADRLDELAAPVVLATRPVNDGGQRYNEAVVWEQGGLRAVHRKAYLPDEVGVWEASWYDQAPPDFTAVDTAAARTGFLVCSELWFGEHARGYARAGVELVASPRATDADNVDKWLAAGRFAAISAGAFCASSNRVGATAEGEFGGVGWVIDPDGALLARTSADEPFVTVDVDLARARAAKSTYPRYIVEG